MAAECSSHACASTHSQAVIQPMPKLRHLTCSKRNVIYVLSASSLALILICYFHPAYEQVGRSKNVKVSSQAHRVGSKFVTEAGLSRTRQEDDWSCPLTFERTSFAEIADRREMPYILGGSQRPVCKNCHEDHLWAHFCKFESQGPVCTEWDKWRLVDSFITRAKNGAPGVEDMLTMTPCDLFQVIEGRTLWLVGDSLTQEMMRATQCFFSEFWDFTHEIKPVSLTDNPAAKAALSKQPTGWNYGIHLTEDIFPYLSDIGAVPSDILVFNFGVWHNDQDSFSGNVSAVELYLAEFMAEMPHLVWREAAPQHFDTPQGEFRCKGCPEPAYPFECKEVQSVYLDTQNNLQTIAPEQQIVVEGGWRNRISRPAMERLGVPILAIWNQSMPLWDYHHNYQVKNDCTHMCHPSAYQLWIAQLYQLLKRSQPQLRPVPTREHPGIW